MDDKRNAQPAVPLTDESIFAQQVGAKVERKLRAQRNGNQQVWFGLGMSGLIGWSVAVPTVLGALLGVWLDERHPGNRSWTLMLLMAGLVVGCANAWHWVAEQNKSMQVEEETTDD